LLNRLMGISTNAMPGQQSLSDMYAPVRGATQQGMGYLGEAAANMPRAQTFEQTVSGIEPMVQRLVAARQAQAAPQRREALRRLTEGSPVGMSRQTAMAYNAQQDLNDTLASLEQILPYAQASQQQQQLGTQQSSALAQLASMFPELASQGVTPELNALFTAMQTQLG